MLHYPFLTDYMLNRDWDCHANECAHQATHAAASAKCSALSSSSGITTQSKKHEFSNVFDRIWFSICIWNLNSNWYQKSWEQQFMEISHVVDLCGLVDAPFFSNRCRLSVVPGHEARQLLD